MAQIESRIADAAKRRAARRRRTQAGWIGALGAVAAAGVLLVVLKRTDAPAERDAVVLDEHGGSGAADHEDTRAKGIARLVAFRQVGDRAERLDEDALVREGDLIQLRYKAGGQPYGVIASVDGVKLPDAQLSTIAMWTSAGTARMRSRSRQ